MASLAAAARLRLLLVASLLQPVVDLDHRVQQAVQSLRPSALDVPMQLATDVGRPQIALGFLLVVAAFGGPPGAALARHAIVALIPTNLVVEGLKRATQRTRPDGEHKPSNASFPSSHAANAFAMAWVLSRRWPRWSIPFYLFAATVGFSRIYLNRHFLSDVLVAVIVGVVCGWGAERLLARSRRWGSDQGKA
jgi:membrane-associated phospholipid phosphatase